jgi:hypothetical protein
MKTERRWESTGMIKPNQSADKLEEAKRHFQEMGCSHFHMGRENPGYYKDYLALGICQETEMAWASETVSATIYRLCHETADRNELWSRHARLTDIVLGYKLNNSLESLLHATLVIEPLLPQKDRLLVAETIVGRQEAKSRKGLIFESLDAGQKTLAEKFVQLVRHLIKEPFAGLEMEARRQRVETLLREITAEGKI